ncbi:hypothetical protein MC885_015817 [Smutsia gigantea]|nr:hypothetical protein MC885_015817 [Smutsia gigantea]
MSRDVEGATPSCDGGRETRVYVSTPPAPPAGTERGDSRDWESKRLMACRSPSPARSSREAPSTSPAWGGDRARGVSLAGRGLERGGAGRGPRRGAVDGRFTFSSRIAFCRPPMHLPLPQPALLLLLAGFAAAATTFRPDWNRLHDLARARVEVSAPLLPREPPPHNPGAPEPWNHQPLCPQDPPSSQDPLVAGPSLLLRSLRVPALPP